MIKGLPKTLAVAALFFATAICSCTKEITITDSVRFAFFSNTYPVSPFSGFTAILPEVVLEIKKHKPAFVIHGGNAIYGGSRDYGIKEKDIRRQLKIFFSKLEELSLPFYLIPGEKDLYNDSAALISEYSGRSSYFSFNYGSIHFVCIGSDKAANFIGDRELQWLQRDLTNQKSSTVFVILSRPFFNGKKSSLPVPEELHKIFVQNKVRFVFSSGAEEFSRNIDFVRYISLNCGGYNNPKDNKKANQYYIINYFENDITIRAYKVNIQ